MYEIGYDGLEIGLPKHLKGPMLPKHLQKRAVKAKRGFSRMHNIPISIRAPEGLEIDGNAKWWIRDDELFASIRVTDLYSGASLNLATNVPLDPIRDLIKQSLDSGAIDIGWNPFKSISDAGKWVGKTVSSVASSKTVQKLTGIVNNPMFKQAMEFVPGGTLALNVTGKAMALVNKAKQGSAAAMAKVANITNLAKQGQSPQVQQLWQFMSNYFRQPQTVVPQVQQMMQQYRNNPYGQMPRFQMPSYQPMQRWGGAPMPFRYPQQYGQMPRFAGDPILKDHSGIDVLPQGQEILGGWLYNRPYRSNADVIVDAATGKSYTPGMLARGAYHKGLAD